MKPLRKLVLIYLSYIPSVTVTATLQPISVKDDGLSFVTDGRPGAMKLDDSTMFSQEANQVILSPFLPSHLYRYPQQPHCDSNHNRGAAIDTEPSPRPSSPPRVSLPVPNPTKSFWLDTPNANPLAGQGSTGPLTRDADVCIIGSGITGVGVAWHLTKLLDDHLCKIGDECSVVILEARRFCSGATGRNGGHLTPDLFSAFRAQEAKYGTEEAIKSHHIERHTADRLLDFIKLRDLQDDVDLVEGGHIAILRTADDEANARKDWMAAQEAGVNMGGAGGGVRWITNEELKEKYGLHPSLNYTGVWFSAHNLWPSKLVTKLYEDAQTSKPRVTVDLHTSTPVTGVKRAHLSAEAVDVNTKRRRWKLETPRGNVHCSYVVHATNGYAEHLLPFLAGTGDDEAVVVNPLKEPQYSPESQTPPAAGDGRRSSPPPEPHSKPEPQRYLGHPDDKQPLSKGVSGIIPTRGQVGAVRAAADAHTLGWHNSWNGGGGGWEYWFPRYQGLALDLSQGVDAQSELESNRPLIILGGGREFSRGRLEMGVTDDSQLNPFVSKALRAFLPSFFDGQFVGAVEDSGDMEGRSQHEDNWEMEWTGIMGYTKSGDPFVGPVGPLAQASGEAFENDYDGQYIAAGYTGHGMPRAFACAEAVATMIVAQMRGEQWTRPSWLPERYLTWTVRM